MRRIAFVISLVGIFVLLGAFMLPAKNVGSAEDLEKLEINTKVILSGKVENERVYGDFRILSVNGISVICNCPGDYLGKNVEILGKVSEYEGKIQIEILRIKGKN